jgi:hypothetical protein
VRKARDVGHAHQTQTTYKWPPEQLEALVRAVFDHGPRWAHIVRMQRESHVQGLVGLTLNDLGVCSKVLFCDISFQTPQCATVFHSRYVSIDMYR